MNQIQPKSFLGFSYVSDPSFSLKGDKACFVVQKPDEAENKYTGDLYILDTASKNVRRLTKSGDAFSYIWTEEGRLLFPAKRTKEEKESDDTVFYEIDPSFGEAEEAFRLPVRASRLVRMKKGHFAVQATENLGEPQKDRAWEIIEESPFWFNGRAFTQGLRGRVYTYDRRENKLKAVTAKGFDAMLIAADEERILYGGAPWKKGLKYEYPGLYLYEMKTGKSTCLIRPNTRPIGLVDFWGENSLLVMTMEKNLNPGMYNQSFYEYDLSSGSLTLLKSFDRGIGSSVGSDARLGGGRSFKVVSAGTKGRKLYFVTTEDEHAFVRTLSAGGRVSGRLTPEGSVDSFDVSGGHLLTAAFHENRLAELYLDGEQVTRLNDAYLAEHTVQTPVYHEFQNADGVMIHGYCLPPAGFDPAEKGRKRGPAKKYPCILHVHGGPATVFGSIYHHEMQVWANAGFFVIYCNPRGSDGRGGAFADICGRYGSIDYEDIMAFTEEMLKKYPAIDRERVGITGGSYGGFMTNWVIGHTDFFKAACSQRSIADWTMFEHTSDIGRFFTVHHQGSRTRESAETLWAHSPLQFAPNCKTPTLFIHSDKDMRCWMVEGISMFNALQMSGCESRFVLFHEETHELSRSGKPKNRIKRMEEILAWFEKYLK